MQKETFKTIFKNKNLIVKRIISPRNFKSQVFIQDHNEWVMILEGSAVLQLRARTIKIKKNQSIFIPKKLPHQILTTSDKSKTVWLAVYIQ